MSEHARKFDEGDSIVQLNFLDTLPFAANFAHTTVFTVRGQLDPEKVQAGFEDLAKQDGWRIITARLRTRPDGKKELHAPRACDRRTRPALNFNLTTTHSAASIKSFPDLHPQPALDDPTPQFFDDISAQHVHLARMDGLDSVEEIISAGDKDQPIFHLQFTLFQDATMLGLSFPHTFTDATGVGELLTAWGLVMGGSAPSRPVATGDPFLARVSEHVEAAPATERVPIQMAELVTPEELGQHELWRKKEGKDGMKSRKIWIPKSYLAGLKEEAKKKGVAEFLSDNDLLYAYGMKLLAATAPENAQRKVSVAQTFSIRRHLPDIFSSDQIYLHNGVCVLGHPTPLSNDFLRTASLIEIAAMARNDAETLLQPPAMHNFLAWFVENTLAIPKTGKIPFLYRPNAFVDAPEALGDIWLQFSSWVKCGLMADWSAAAAEGQPKGTGRFVRIDDLLGGGITHDVIFALCRDEAGRFGRGVGQNDEGGYWLAAAAQTGTWDRIMEEMKSVPRG